MVVVMQEGATEEAIQRVINKLMGIGFDIHRSTGARHTVLGAVGAKVDFDTRDIELLEGVAEVLRISAPSSRAPRLTAFRALGRRAWRCFERPRTAMAWWWSPKSWTKPKFRCSWN